MSKKKTAKESAKLAPPSPRSGVRLPVGAHAGNTGGKKGRSGRRPDEFRELLAGIRDKKGLRVVHEILDGELTYTLRGKCEHCGKQSKGRRESRAVPTPDTRARVVEMLFKHTLPAEKVVRLDGVRDAALVLDVIKDRIRTRLGQEIGNALIADITETLLRHRS